MQRKDHPFSVFRGLQKPLVFQSFKGKFIYWGAGFALLSFVNAIVFQLIGGYVLSLIAMAITLIGGLYFTAQRQKRGLHTKTQSKGLYMVNKISH